MTPNEYTYDDIVLGLEKSFVITITPAMLSNFCAITGDLNPLHNDEEYAKSLGYSGRLGYGMMTASFLSTMAGMYLPGKYSIIHGVEISFPNPVVLGDTLTVAGKVRKKDDTFRYFVLKVSITNQRGEKVCRGNMQIGVIK